jgi:hypothetical protein
LLDNYRYKFKKKIKTLRDIRVSLVNFDKCVSREARNVISYVIFVSNQISFKKIRRGKRAFKKNNKLKLLK